MNWNQKRVSKCTYIIHTHPKFVCLYIYINLIYIYIPQHAPTSQWPERSWKTLLDAVAKVVPDLEKFMDALNQKLSAMYEMIGVLDEKDNPPPMERYRLYFALRHKCHFMGGFTTIYTTAIWMGHHVLNWQYVRNHFKDGWWSTSTCWEAGSSFQTLGTVPHGNQDGWAWQEPGWCKAPNVSLQFLFLVCLGGRSPILFWSSVKTYIYIHMYIYIYISYVICTNPNI